MFASNSNYAQTKVNINSWQEWELVKVALKKSSLMICRVSIIRGYNSLIWFCFRWIIKCLPVLTQLAYFWGQKRKSKARRPKRRRNHRRLSLFFMAKFHLLLWLLLALAFIGFAFFTLLSFASPFLFFFLLFPPPSLGFPSLAVSSGS